MVCGTQLHDFLHVLTGYGATIPGELALAAHYLAQLRFPYHAIRLAVTLAHSAFVAPQHMVGATDAFVDGWQYGRASRNITFERWAEPLSALQREMNLRQIHLAAYAAMARPFSTPEHREEIRRTIRSAAAELYRRDGLSAISVRRVAQKAGVSVGAIYAHFDDLAGLMQSLWMGKVERQNERFVALTSGCGDPLLRLRVPLEDYLRFGIDNGELNKSAFLFVRPGSHPKPVAFELETQVFSRLMMHALREGLAQGRIVAGDPAHLAQALWSGLHGCLALPSNLDRLAFVPPADIAPLMTEALMRSITPLAQSKLSQSSMV